MRFIESLEARRPIYDRPLPTATWASLVGGAENWDCEARLDLLSSRPIILWEWTLRHSEPAA